MNTVRADGLAEAFKRFSPETTVIKKVKKKTSDPEATLYEVRVTAKSFDRYALGRLLEECCYATVAFTITARGTKVVFTAG